MMLPGPPSAIAAVPRWRGGSPGGGASAFATSLTVIARPAMRRAEERGASYKQRIDRVGQSVNQNIADQHQRED